MAVPFEGTNGRKLPRGSRRVHLVESLASQEVLQAVFAEVAECDSLRPRRLDQLVRGSRAEDLAAMRCRSDSYGPVNVDADVADRTERRLAGMEPHSHAQLDTVGPLCPGSFRTDFDRRPYRVGSTGEGGEHPVAGMIDDTPIPPLDRAGRDSPVAGKNLFVAFGVRLEELGRPLDVGKEKGDRSRRETRARRAHEKPP